MKEQEDFRTYLKKYKKKSRTHFRGHEGISFYLSIEPLRQLQEFGVLTEKEVQNCLTIISMHGSLFDNIDADGEMKKASKVFDKFNDVDLFGAFVTQVKCDSLGRFFTSKDGRKNNAERLGTEIFTQQQFLDYKEEQAAKVLNEPLTACHYPWINVLIGAPGSGKSTYIDKLMNLDTDFVTISRDESLMDYAKLNDIEGNYSEVWKQLTDDDQKEVDKLLEVTFRKAVKYKQNLIVDMTNMSNKAQRKWTNKVNAPKSYRAVATVFATSYSELQRRLDTREKETGKAIPDFVIKNMMKGFMVPNFTNFSKISWVF